MNNKQQLFSEKDRRLLEATSKSTWTPPDPQKLLVPYIKEDQIEGETELEKRRNKTKAVIEGYTKIIEKCEEIRADLKERCKNVTIPIDSKKDKVVLDAARRFFQRDITEITFEMYVEAVHAMAQMGNETVPTIGGK